MGRECASLSGLGWGGKNVSHVSKARHAAPQNVKGSDAATSHPISSRVVKRATRPRLRMKLRYLALVLIMLDHGIEVEEFDT
jgi:hypothetical protein